MQSLGTVTSQKRTVSVDVVVKPTGYVKAKGFGSNLPFTASGIGMSVSGCGYLAQAPSVEVNNWITSFNPSYCNNGLLVYKTEDTENWEPMTGKYGRRVSWVFTPCNPTDLDGDVY